MKQNVIIEINSNILSGGENEKINVTTRGHRLVKDGVIHLSYKETDQSGYDGNSVLLKIDGEKQVTINRMGSARSQMIIESGRRHQMSYQTPFGATVMGITGGAIRLFKEKEGQNIEINYELDINQELVSKNHLLIKVKECAN